MTYPFIFAGGRPREQLAENIRERAGKASGERRRKRIFSVGETKNAENAREITSISANKNGHFAKK